MEGFWGHAPSAGRMLMWRKVGRDGVGRSGQHAVLLGWRLAITPVKVSWPGDAIPSRSVGMSTEADLPAKAVPMAEEFAGAISMVDIAYLLSRRV